MIAIFAALALGRVPEPPPPTPIIAHEWGVQLFAGPEAALQSPPLPGWVHRAPAAQTPVRTLPPDSGARAIPVLQLYAELEGVTPLAVAVGFSHGESSTWYPQVDQRLPQRYAGSGPQLVWEQLLLSPSPLESPPTPAPAWVKALRAEPALWISRGPEEDRFLFYEATTWEQPAVVATERPDRPGWFDLRNRSDWTAEAVWVIQRREGRLHVARAGALAPGDTTLAITEGSSEQEVRGALMEEIAAPITPQRWCLLQVQRDHLLTPGEATAMLDLWLPRLLPEQGITVLYRESQAGLDALAPLSLSPSAGTCLYSLNRLSLVGWRLEE
ncbi:MAG: hypothetical protein JXX28_02300 [Deltaproteobacteria bacterium]|nr:hypothetical protein [Deltaproteobacteria bacterium]